MKSVSLFLMAFASASFAKEDPNAVLLRDIANLKREVSALESMKAEKLDSLEQKEAARWEARYKAAAKAKEAEEQSRVMEETYSRLAGEASRLEEELVKAKNDADEKKELLTAAQEAHGAIATQVRRRVDEAASTVSSDFPVGLEARTMAYSSASQILSGKEP